MKIQCRFCFEDFDERFEICPFCGHTLDERQKHERTLPLNTIIDGKYVIGETIESNHDGYLYLGWDNLLHIKVEVSEFFPERCRRFQNGKNVICVDNPDGFTAESDRLYKEALKWSRVRNADGLVRILDVVHENETIYIIREHVDGILLADCISRDEETEEAFEKLSPIMDTIAVLHKEGITYQGLNAASVLVDNDGKYLLKDHITGKSEKGDFNLKVIEDIAAMAELFRQITPEKLETIRTACAIDSDGYTSMENFRDDLKKEIYGKSVIASIGGEDDEQDDISVDFFGDNDELDEKKGKKTGIIVAAILMALLLGGGGAAAYYTGFLHNVFGSGKYLEKVEVPDLVGQNIDEAILSLKEEGLVCAIEDKQYVKGTEPDIILSQDIEPGESVEANTTINVVVSDEQQVEIVPSVLGLSESSGKSILEYKGFYTKITYAYDDIIAEGYIVSQNPDNIAEVGSTIAMVVSKGMDPEKAAKNEEIEMPDLVGMDYDDVVALAKKTGFSLEVTERKYSDKYSKNIVISQNIEEKTKIKTGDIVKITVSLGKEQVIVPNVRLLTEETAISSLINRNLKYGVSYEYSNTIAEGYVISQSISSGTTVDKNTVISIVVSKGKKTVKTPNVVGMTETAARSQLSSLGLQTTVSYQEDDNNVGKVISQGIRSGRTVDQGSTVSIVVGQASSKVSVPVVAGMSKTAATSALTSVGLNVATSEAYDDTVAEGYVISQSPSSGRLAKGTSVAIVVSLGAKPSPTVPSEAESEKNSEAEDEKSSETESEKSSEAEDEKSSETESEKSSEAEGEKSSEAENEKSSEATSEASSEKSSEASYEKSSEASSEKSSEASSEKSSEASSEKSSEASSEKSSEASSEKSSEADSGSTSESTVEKADEKIFEENSSTSTGSSDNNSSSDENSGISGYSEFSDDQY